jgi:hypothetical protein
VKETRKAKAPRSSIFPLRIELDDGDYTISAPTEGRFFITGMLISQYASATTGKFSIANDGGEISYYRFEVGTAIGLRFVEFPSPIPCTESNNVLITNEDLNDYTGTTDLILFGYNDSSPS